MRDEFTLIQQALDLLKFLVEDSYDETDKKIAQWGLEALEELKQKKEPRHD